MKVCQDARYVSLNDQNSQQDVSDVKDSDDQHIVETRQNTVGGGEGQDRDQERATKRARL